MITEVKEILNNDVEVVIKSPQLSLSLLKCYSLLYISGAQPRACARSQRDYYRKLQIDGIMRAELAEKVKARTCVPAWNGLKYVRKACKHYSNLTVHDEQAIDALERGFLKEADFSVLPDGYEKEAKEEVKKPKKRGRKPKTEE